MSKQSMQAQFTKNFKIDSLIMRPQNIGPIDIKEAAETGGELFIHHYGSQENGLEITVYMVIDPEQNRVLDTRFTLFGEPELIAVLSMLGVVARNKNMEELLAIKEKGLEYFLREHPNRPALPKSKRYLVAAALEAISETVAAYRGETPDEKADTVVCGCAEVSLATIEKVIREHDLKSVDEITDYTRAGGFCKSCISPGSGEFPRNHYLVDILKGVREEMQKAATVEVADIPFKDMSIEQKRAAIEAIIDRHIRQMLVMDGGDMEILDIKENGEHTDLYIRYLGACNGCASASTGTLFAIEGILKQKLDPNIRAIPI